MQKKPPRAKFNPRLCNELIALNIQYMGSQDIVFPLRRKYSKQSKTWIYECEITTNLDIPVQLQNSLRHPPDSIVSVKEENLTLELKED